MRGIAFLPLRVFYASTTSWRVNSTCFYSKSMILVIISPYSSLLIVHLLSVSACSLCSKGSPADDLPPIENENFPSAIAIGSNFITVLAAPEWERNGKLKVTCASSDPFVVAGAEREPSADVFFKLSRTGDTDRIIVRLTIDQMDLFMKNSCPRNCPAFNRRCGPTCKTAFIHQVTIDIRPKWADVDCRRLILQPYRTAEVFELQRNASMNIQVPFVCPDKASVSYQSGNTVSQTAPAFGFSPARRDGPTVSWTWRVSRFANGTKIELDKLRWGSRLQLPIQTDQMHIHPDSFRAEVEWELQPQAELQSRLQLEPLEFDCKINLHTAVFKRKSRLPAYSVITGPKVSFDTLLTFNKQGRQER